MNLRGMASLAALFCGAAFAIAAPFSAEVTAKDAVLRTGALTARISRWTPALRLSGPSGEDILSPAMQGLGMEEFRLVVDGDDHKVLAWVGAPSMHAGSLSQFTCVYEIWRGVEAVFVSSRLYNRESAYESHCNFLWCFQAKDEVFASSSGAVRLAGAGQRLQGVESWAFFASPGGGRGLGLVTDGLGAIQRKIASNASPTDWDKEPSRVWMWLASNDPGDGLHDTTGLGARLWKFKEGEYNEIKFAAFQADSKEACAAMFEKLSGPEFSSLWKYDQKVERAK